MAYETELLKRAEDLRARCERSGGVTHTNFLTPAERYELAAWSRNRADCRLVFSGGAENAQRQVGFFLPQWYMDDTPPAEEYLRAVKVTAGFGTPGHRDYLGSALALGIKREWLGDIIISGSEAHILCLGSVADTLLLDLDHVGRCGVKCCEVSLSDVPPVQLKSRSVTFTVQSARFDTVVGAMFGMSRTAACKLIEAGAASLNYSVCMKLDAAVEEGDIISLRGYGKGELSAEGGRSRKGRTFWTAKIYE
ncbi:MAG: hypothetical protein IJP01_03505 [Oscillospiraceae bacterium]|nr:hypothetical protein [Oscillospiraceae bacterium]